MSDNSKKFQRTRPTTVAALSEKPMTSWASGKIKRIYDGYESFCQEIGNLLGEPTSRPEISSSLGPHMIDEFDLLWEKQLTPDHNIQQLLTWLPSLYRAGFVIHHSAETSRIKSYFMEGSALPPKDLLEQVFQQISHPQTLEAAPTIFDAHPIFRNLGLQNLSWHENFKAYHFWLYPARSTSLILVSDSAEPQRSQIAEKTQGLIQRRFYVDT